MGSLTGRVFILSVFFKTAVRFDYICLDFLSFFASGKHASILKVLSGGTGGGGVSKLTKPGHPPPRGKAGIFAELGLFERAPALAGVARPVPAVCAIDLH